METLVYNVSTMGDWTVKVHGHWLDKWSEKQRCYVERKFRSKAAAERAAKERIALNRKLLSGGEDVPSCTNLS